MNVTLIYPLLSRKRSRIDENKQYWPPLGLAYIAAFLEVKGHRVQILDRDAMLRKNNMDFDKTDTLTVEAVKEFGSNLVGISATTPNMSDASFLSRLIKERYKGVPIVLGGPHPTGEPVLSMEESPHIDAVARGEGELIMSELAALAPFETVKGLTYRKGAKIVSNADREPIADIDSLPMPARHLLDMKFYTRPSRFTSRNLNLRTTSIFTARGCPYRCNFCAGPLVFKGKVRFHSPGRVMSEIEELVSKYSVEALYFAEDMFLSSKARAEEILDLFIDKGIDRKIKWMAQAKASIITTELLGLMKRAGCVGIEYGFESGSQRVLDLMNKRLRVEESLKAADLTKKARLRFQANIIVGYPGEREEDFKKTVAFIKKISPSMIGFNIFMPLPGTPSYEELKREGRPMPRWEDIGDPEAPQINYADMPKGVFEELYLKTRLKVILPINLRNFIMDNIKNPTRLIRIGLTQFKGVLIKTARSLMKLRRMKALQRDDATNVLFISYNGLLEPILPSQAVPYLTKLSEKGYKFVLLTYEKKGDIKKTGKQAILEMRSRLKSQGIEWRFLRYHKNPPAISTLLDLVIGAAVSIYIILRKRIGIVHARGITPGVIFLLISRLLKVKVLFDMRGLLAEEYVGGGIWKEGGLSYRLVKKAEEKLLKKADAVTVLTKKHFDINKALGPIKGTDKPMDVVPCCVDMNMFNWDAGKASGIKKMLGLEGKFILMYPGKIGTFYLMEEMVGFYKEMKRTIPDSVFLILTNDRTEALLDTAFRQGIAEDAVRVISGIRYDRMPEYVRIADAGIFFINPYKKLGSSPIKMGEFLASGVPVIINPGVGDTEEIVTEGRVGVVVRGFDVDHYRAATLELAGLMKEGRALKERCRSVSERYLSLDRGAEKYEEIYRALGGEKR